MESREKLRRALSHQSGLIPIDFGSTAVTGIHVSIIEKLRECFGLAKQPVKVNEPYQMLGVIEDDLRKEIGIDTLGIPAPKTLFGFPIENYKPWTSPWGQELLVPEKFTTKVGPDGTYLYPQGDADVPPSGHMPSSGFFFDTIVRQEPIDESRLNPEDNLEEFGPLSEEDLRYFTDSTAAAASKGSLGLVATFPGMGFGDIALVPAPFLKRPKGIRDIAEWYMSTAIRQDYILQVFDKQVDYAIKNLKILKDKLGNKIDVVFLCGTDFGTQQGSFCSIETFKKLWKPYYIKMNNWIHANTNWKTFKHSCGAVYPFISEFIDSGFDILNPVQCSAKGMDPATIKAEFGDRIVFWGGGVDTQNTLPFASPEQVRNEVLARCEIFSKNGGFVFNAIHNIQAKTPVKNVIAMLDAVKEFNGQRDQVLKNV